MDEQIGVRIDRWLWAARFFRTRSLAKSAVAGGKVYVDDQRVKPAKELRVGQIVQINKDGVLFTVIVQKLSEQRGSATIAQTLYEETANSIEKRQATAHCKQFLGHEFVIRVDRTAYNARKNHAEMSLIR